MSNIVIVGTSHIAKQSLRKVKNTIGSLKPAFVAVELDKKRLIALTSENSGRRPSARQMIKRVGLQGYLFSLLGGWISRKLGEKVGVFPGSDMLSAIHEAHKVGARVLLIDQDIEVTLREFSRRITWKEKLRIVWDIIKGIFVRDPLTSIDLSKVPEQQIIEKMLGRVRTRYPNIYDVLVHRRNVVMARRLVKIHRRHPDASIVAIVGAGHEKGMLELVQKYLNKSHQ